MHGTKRIGGLVQTAGGQPFFIRADGQRAHAAEIDLLSAFVCVQRLRVERTQLLAAGNFPLPYAADEIAAEQILAFRMKCHAVDVPRVAA